MIQKPLGLELPNTVDLVVAETEPNIKGDTSSGWFKASYNGNWISCSSSILYQRRRYAYN